MSISTPLRNVRASVFQRQCIFQRQQCRLDRAIAASTIRAFSSTPPRARSRAKGFSDNTLNAAAAKDALSREAAPGVNLENAKTSNLLGEDIGLLQNTIVRASLKSLPPWYSGAFWTYFWKFLRAKFSGLYSRIAYRKCKQKKGWTRQVPIDLWNTAQLRYTAEKMYEGIYHNFAKGDIGPLRKICLPPLLSKFENRLAARLPQNMDWALHKFKSCRIVSDRAALIGEEYPDTAFRQIVVRLESVQSLAMTHRPSSTNTEKSSKGKSVWKPDVASTRQRPNPAPKPTQQAPSPVNNAIKKTVVEYMVLQRRIVSGKEEPWKVWGFTSESTPATVKEEEAFWKNSMDYQASGGT